MPLTAVLSGIFCDLDEDGMPVSSAFCDLEGVCFSAPVVRMLSQVGGCPNRRFPSAALRPDRQRIRVPQRIEKAPHTALSGAFLIHAEP